MASNDFIAIDVTGIKELNAKLSTLAPAVQGMVVDDVSKYLIGVFRKEPPQNHSISRRQAYPDAFAVTPTGKLIQGYFSYRQFKYVQYLRSKGKIPYTRTHEMRRAWHQVGKGAKSIIANETTAAVFAMGDDTQARQLKLVGWRTIGDIIKERTKQIERVANDAARKAIKKRGLS